MHRHSRWRPPHLGGRHSRCYLRISPQRPHGGTNGGRIPWDGREVEMLACGLWTNHADNGFTHAQLCSQPVAVPAPVVEGFPSWQSPHFRRSFRICL
jgi:hypothetical protein